ncbi:MAG: SBBP repeat-containing protein [Myxococcales bacterium]|nr:SBBP repeat-containing protein [Myxococcales bacterium]
MIDPTIAWGSYLGGTGFEGRGPIAVDGAGNVYVSGDVGSSDFPASVGDLTVGGSFDAFVAKVSSAGTLLWATYLGGGNWEGAGGIATEPGGTNVYVAGYTQSSDFPATAGLDTSLGGSRDGFLTKLTMAGGLVAWSTYLGGTSYDVAKAVTVSAGLDVFVTGYTGSTNFPTTGGFDTTLGGAQNAFVTRFASTGSIAFSSYLGGAGSETGTGIAVDAAGNAFVTGNTDSTDFPTGSGFDTTLGGGQDAFVTKVATAGTLTWSSYLGGSSGIPRPASRRTARATSSWSARRAPPTSPRPADSTPRSAGARTRTPPRSAAPAPSSGRRISEARTATTATASPSAAATSTSPGTPTPLTSPRAEASTRRSAPSGATPWWRRSAAQARCSGRRTSEAPTATSRRGSRSTPAATST